MPAAGITGTAVQMPPPADSSSMGIMTIMVVPYPGDLWIFAAINHDIDISHHIFSVAVEFMEECVFH